MLSKNIYISQYRIILYIDKVEIFHVSIPLRKPFFSSWIPGYPQTHNKFDLIQLTTNTGETGLSAGVAFGEERAGLGGLLAPYLIGVDPTDLDLIHQRITEGSFLGWRNFFIDAACYDLKAKLEGKPVWKMLGGTKEKIPVYWSTGSVCDPEKHSKIIEQAESEGYKAVKLRVKSNSVENDIKLITNTRKKVNSDFPLAIDANQGWLVTIVDRTPAWSFNDAKQFIDGIKDSNISWLEEPLEMHKYETYRKLRDYSSIPISGSELNNGWHEAKMFLHFGSLDIYQPDCTVFGIYDTLKVINEVKKQGLKYSPHTWTNGVGLWINMHLYSLGSKDHPLEYPHEPGSWEPKYRDGILKEPIIPDDGYLELSDEPGLGIPIDWAKVKKYGKKVFSMSSSQLKMKVIKEKGIKTALKLKKRKENIEG